MNSCRGMSDITSSTRRSRMPRARSCCSTIFRRCSSYEAVSPKLIRLGCSATELCRLPFAAPYFYVEADDAVLVANRHYRDISGNVILSPNDLLGSLRHVGGVSDGEIVLHL